MEDWGSGLTHLFAKQALNKMSRLVRIHHLPLG